jgi:hypothetical protein
MLSFFLPLQVSNTTVNRCHRLGFDQRHSKAFTSILLSSTIFNWQDQPEGKAKSMIRRWLKPRRQCRPLTYAGRKLIDELAKGSKMEKILRVA